MTPDESHQALDAEIGNILDRYHGGYIGMDKVKKQLARLFGDPEGARLHNDLFVYLSRVMDQNRFGEISADALRADLVRMAALAKTDAALFVDHIWRESD